MLRYYKLTKHDDGMIIYDYSSYEQHYKIQVTLSVSIWANDPNMELEINQASKILTNQKDLMSFYEDDFS